ncbi:MAG: single-stranded DNA-binding protein [Acholeplasmataceae bacterium]|jgi:single-strand DNA-binding protein|nr:single-stranded DNA-binding protein [Acholeplasmataceae bacterium]MDY0316835.1 single-stranded DNA-binding protein [Acholeplasmatales bacterium]
MNRVVLVGRITKDPELKYTQSNVPFVNFSIAVNRTFVNNQGEREADFINCVVWRAQAENLAKFISKGGLIGVDGRLQTRTYQTQTGENRYITEVVCDSVQFIEAKSNNNNPSHEVPADDDPFLDSAIDIASEDDLPF